MNGSIFRRVVWKEYRQIRSFWIAIFLLTLLFLTVAAAYTLPARSIPPHVFFSIGLAFPAFYALGIGATLFATEHETGTYAFLRALPTSAWRQLLGRFAFAVTSVVAMFAACWLAAFAYSRGTLPDAEYHLELWALWGCIALDLLLWGTLFSLLVKNPLAAAGLGVTAAILSVGLVGASFDTSLDVGAYMTSFTPLRLAVASAVALAVFALGLCWFREGSTARGAGWDDLSSYDLSPDVTEGATIAKRSHPPAAVVFRRLVWQQYRQTRGMTLVLFAMIAPLVLFIVTESTLNARRAFLVICAVLSGELAAVLSGVIVFRADQRRPGVDFLAQRGARPTLVWLSRHAVSSMLPLAVLAVFGLWIARVAWMSPGPADEALLYYSDKIILCGVLMLSYAFGQLCSMFFKSGVIALFLTGAGIAAWCLWAQLMYVLQISWLWSVAPVVPVLLAATWLRTARWMEDRNTVRDWARPVGLLVGYVAATLVAVCLYRVYEIPYAELNFSPEEYAADVTPEALETSALYARADELLQPISSARFAGDMWGGPVPDEELIARETEWLEANQESLAILLEASQRESCDAYCDPRGGAKWAGEDEAGQLARLLTAKAERLQADGQLDEALEYYTATLRFDSHARRRNRSSLIELYVESRVYDDLVTWAVEPNQTPERILLAVESIDERVRRDNRPDGWSMDPIMSEHMWQSQLLSDDMESLDNSGHDPTVLRMVRWLPWERTRARRLLNFITARNIEMYSPFDQMQPQVRASLDRESNVDLESLLERTLLLNSSISDIARLPSSGSRWTEARCSALNLRLLLVAWRLEHGELPDSLQPLTTANPERSFTDPWLGEPFRYFPEGVEGELSYHTFDSGESRERKLAPGKPFVWSTNVSFSNDIGFHDPRQGYRDLRGGREFGTEMEVLEQGAVYPIP